MRVHLEKVGAFIQWWRVSYRCTVIPWKQRSERQTRPKATKLRSELRWEDGFIIMGKQDMWNLQERGFHHYKKD